MKKYLIWIPAIIILIVGFILLTHPERAGTLTMVLLLVALGIGAIAVANEKK